MNYILNIETSTPVCSVALQRDAELLGSFTIYTDRSHSEQLALLADQLMVTCNIDKVELSAIAVSSGPGSYTGLRIGTSFAKGLCYALKIPLITIGSLEAMAAGMKHLPDTGYLIPMMDARRMEVYLQVCDSEAEPVENPRPFLLEEESLGDYLDKGTCYIFGNGSNKAAGVIDHPNARFISNFEADARHMCEKAWHSYVEGKFADLAYFEPAYLKEFRATKPKKLI